jgi:hypothetical protein
MYFKSLNFFKEESFTLRSQCLWRVDVPDEVAAHSHRHWPHRVNAYSLKNFRHLEYTYINVLYISEAHRWSDEHDVSCLFTSYTWPSRQKFMF